MSAQIPTKKGSKIEVKMTGRKARAEVNAKQTVFMIKLDRLKSLEVQIEIKF